MAISNKERQKKWLEKNRALHNFRRRKKNLPVPVLADAVGVNRTQQSDGDTDGEARESTNESQTGIQKVSDSRGGQNDLGSGLSGGDEVADVIHSLPPAQTSKDETLDRLRGLIKVEQEKPAVESPMPVKRVYRSETGMVITKEQWEKREEEKNKARSKGFEIDEYAQA